MRDDAVDLVDDVDRVRTGLTLDGEDDGALAVIPGRDARVLHAVERVADIAETDRCSVSIGDDLAFVLRTAQELAICVDQRGLRRAVQRSRWRIDVGALDRGGDLVDADLARRHRQRIDLHAGGVELRAVHKHLGDAVERRQLPREQVFRVFVEDVARHGRRLHRDEHDRLVGGIDLPERGRARQVGRQLPAGSLDCRLNVFGGAVDIAVEIELDGDAGLTLRTLRGHRGHAGNRGELALERRGDGRGHGLGVGAGQACRNLDGGEVDGRKLADRKRRIAEQSEGDDGDHHQGRHDGQADERRGNIHCAPGGTETAKEDAGFFEIATTTPGTMRS